MQPSWLRLPTVPVTPPTRRDETMLSRICSKLSEIAATEGHTANGDETRRSCHKTRSSCGSPTSRVCECRFSASGTQHKNTDTYESGKKFSRSIFSQRNVDKFIVSDRSYISILTIRVLGYSEGVSERSKKRHFGVDFCGIVEALRCKHLTKFFPVRILFCI